MPPDAPFSSISLGRDMEQVVLYRKGWQVMARIDLKPDGAQGRKYGLSLAYPVFALNRLAAGWQNRPEFQVALGD